MTIALTLYAMSMMYWLGFCVATRDEQSLFSFLAIPVWFIAMPIHWWMTRMWGDWA